MAPRPNWKGFLRLSLVTCPVALYPATSESEKISFNQLNKQTGHRIKYLKIDAETGDEVTSDDIVKGYKVDTDRYVQVTPDEIEGILPESSRTIDIDEFVPKSEIDDLYLVRPYYLVPDGKVGHDAYAVIRETIKSMNKIAIARVVLTNREHIIALQARGKGLMGMLLRYPYEVRDENEYFDDIQDVKVTKDMLDLAKHIVDTKAGHFEPENFEDEYENAMIELINRKKAGMPIPKGKPREDNNVIDLMDALRRSLGKTGLGKTSPDKTSLGKTSDKSRSAAPASEAKSDKKSTMGKTAKGKSRKRVAGQTEMLLPIAGKSEAKQRASKDVASKELAKKPARATSRQRKTG
jgi:DNA end-binding protein Ku